MDTTLIDQFLDAAHQWSEKTNQPLFTIIVLSLGDIGAMHHYTQHPPKSGETADFRADLIHLLKTSQISQALLISGLIKTIEIQLTHYAVIYNAAAEDWQSKADFFQRMADDPEFRDQIIADFNRYQEEQGFESRTLHDLASLQRAANHFRGLANDVDDNEAERKMMLLTWQEVTAPLLAYSNLWPLMEKDYDNLPRPPSQ